MMEVKICSIPVQRHEYTTAIEDILHRFLGAHMRWRIVAYARAGGTHNSEIRLSTEENISKEELEKLQILCRFRCNQLTRSLTDHPNSPPPQYIPSSPKVPAPKTRPDTIRIKNIPISYSKEFVKLTVHEAFHSKPLIHSLAPYNKDYLCATATFPDEPDLEYPLRQLLVLKQAHRPRPGKADFQYDTDFFGLTPLWDAVMKGDDATVDIVAVVGLGTHAFGTFRSPTSGSYEMWLRDFLPNDIPNTRILLYGYPSTVDGGQSIENVGDMGGTFLNRLTLLRKSTSTRDRPIIFIGQSLGGLIVQEALLRAESSQDSNELEIFNAWHGLVGFGIPIGGLNNPSLIEAVKDQPNKVLISQLCIDEYGTPSPYLRELKTRFEKCCARKEKSSYAPDILYFWERHFSQPRTRNGIVGEKVRMVEDNTETPGARNLPLNSDHSGMVKYSSKSDLLYEDVCNNINHMVGNIIEQKDMLISQASPTSKGQGGKGKQGVKGPRGGPKRKGTFVSGGEMENLTY